MKKKLRALFVVVCVIALFLPGCSLRLDRFMPKDAPVSDLPAEALLLNGEDIYQQTLTFIQDAKTSIYIEQTVLEDPSLIGAVIQKAQAGVEVRILLDQWQSANKATVEQLKNHNISVQYYPALKGQLNHVKMLVVDYTQAILYGAAWRNEDWASHTIAVVLPEKSSRRCADVFAKDWEFTTTLSLSVPENNTAPADQITLAKDANVKQQILPLIRASTQAIDIELTEISDPDTAAALIQAAEKDVAIRLLVDADQAKNTPVTLENLQTQGVVIRYYQNSENQPALNCNFALFDHTALIFSGSGWTNAVFVRNHEYSVTIPSAAATAKLSQFFETDWQAASPDLL
ncbi:MAG: phosphatidylserine/phosphatidylglycerophosphate/cardiolipin synthase family protein [Peptococcaceae bacterium]|jgi:phosphatidylserine/phosphatidylglycerophosphate/cardiolipin synthase-like enzyme|nr:phosphatidylserine/phosphatidylglycerophosphate/cardiolipin synthase family protein [Peptococcaceae bacterium]